MDDDVSGPIITVGIINTKGGWSKEPLAIYNVSAIFIP